MTQPVNLKNGTDFGFGALLYYMFIIASEHDVASVSEKMKISPDTLYRYVRGALPFPIDRLPDLVNATDNLKFLEYFANKCDYTVIPKIKDRHTAEMMIRVAQMFMSATNGNEAQFLRRKK